jgi:DNA-binding GntR family transcriptional regulator
MRLSMQRKREETLAALKSSATVMDQAYGVGDNLRSARADDDFHDAAIANSGNPYLINAYKLVSGKIAALRSHQSNSPTRQLANAEHHHIIHLLEAGDMSVALEVWGVHIMKMAERYDVAPDSQLSPGGRTSRGPALTLSDRRAPSEEPDRPRQ